MMEDFCGSSRDEETQCKVANQTGKEKKKTFCACELFCHEIALVTTHVCSYHRVGKLHRRNTLQTREYLALGTL